MRDATIKTGAPGLH